MHDLHAADKVLKIVLAAASERKLKKVDKIIIELGKVAEHGEEIKPENLTYNVGLLARNTVAEGCRVVVNTSSLAKDVLVKEIEGN